MNFFATVRLSILCALFHCLFFSQAADANVTAYLKIPDIPGESQRADHEDEIDIHGLSWKVEAPATTGSGRTLSQSVVGPIFLKKYVDASSPYIALSTLNARNFESAVLAVRKDSGDAHLDYLVITLGNARIVSYEMETKEGSSLIEETIGITFESITYKYTVQEDDHSAGDEHEITYDIAAGA